MFAARHHLHRPNGYLLSIISTHWQLQSSVIKCQLGHCNIVLSEISFMISQNPQKPVAIIHKNGLVPVLKCINIMDHINTFLFS